MTLHSTIKPTLSVHGGKLQGIRSFSNDKFSNSFCLKKSRCKDSICSDCYVDGIYERYGKNLENKMKLQSKIWSSKHFVAPELKIKDKFIRFNSFGELMSEQHLVNVVRTCQCNASKLFTLWTKKHWLVKRVMRKYGKPTNLILIYSNEYKNSTAFLPEYFDKSFNVMTSDSDLINCGKKKCKACMLCYSKNDVKFIYEKIK